MAKITIIEDDLSALREDYSGLNKSHEVHVRFYIGNANIPTGRINYLTETLVQAGFDRSRFSLIRTEDNPTNGSNIYFVDGLEGKWKDFAGRLPKEKVVICSSGSYTVADAKREGYHAIDKDSDKEEAIAKVRSQ